MSWTIFSRIATAAQGRGHSYVFSCILQVVSVSNYYSCFINCSNSVRWIIYILFSFELFHLWKWFTSPNAIHHFEAVGIINKRATWPAVVSCFSNWNRGKKFLLTPFLNFFRFSEQVNEIEKNIPMQSLLDKIISFAGVC